MNGANGYELAHFQDAFDRYLPDPGLSKRDNVTSPWIIDEYSIFKSVTPKMLSRIQIRTKPPPTLRCHGVTLQTPVGGRKGGHVDMNQSVELCQRAVRLGLRLEPRGDKLAVIPAKRCPPEFAAELRQHKGEF